MQYMYCAQKPLMHTSEDVQSTQVQNFHTNHSVCLNPAAAAIQKRRTNYINYLKND